MNQETGHLVRPDHATATMDVPLERAKLPVSRKRIMKAMVMLLRAGMIEDSGERRMNRRGEPEPVYRVVRKRG
jgi:hypothetical protein